jgi:hypothetical protein
MKNRFFFGSRSCFAKFYRHQTCKQINPPLLPEPIHPTKMSISSLPPDLWYEIFGLLDIDEAIAISKAHPQLFGAFIEEKQGIRFRNAVNSYLRSSAVDLPVGSLSSFVCHVSRGSSLEFSVLSLGSRLDSALYWRRVLL